MTENNQKQLGKTLWAIADQLRGAMNADDFRDYILPHGVRFRGGAEAKIRRKLLDDGHIDTIIGLPANLFYSTGIPVCVLVLKKCKKPDDVLFSNASEHFEKGKPTSISRRLSTPISSGRRASSGTPDAWRWARSRPTTST